MQHPQTYVCVHYHVKGVLALTLEPCYVRAVNEAPNGYPRTATFLDSDENFMIYRRFGYLQSRLLLEKQDDLQRLELKLDIMDNGVASDDEDSLRTRLDYGEEYMEERQTLTAQIEKKWLEYCKSCPVLSSRPSLHSAL